MWNRLYVFKRMDKQERQYISEEVAPNFWFSTRNIKIMGVWFMKKNLYIDKKISYSYNTIGPYLELT